MQSGTVPSSLYVLLLQQSPGWMAIRRVLMVEITANSILMENGCLAEDGKLQ